MKRLKVGDTVKLWSGYDYDPRWYSSMKKHKNHFRARVLRFYDNEVEKRKDDERLSAAIEFDELVGFDGLQGRHGYILGRWEGQTWDTSGVVHVHLTSKEIFKQSDISVDDSRWMESHASYEKIDA